MLKSFFKTEVAKLKNMSGKEKAVYIWTYYKWIIIGVVIGVILITNFTITMIKKPGEQVLSVAIVNDFSGAHVDETVEEFKQYAGIDDKKTGVVFENSYYFELDNNYFWDSYEYQSFINKISASYFDAIIADETTINCLINMGATFMQLDSEKYADYFVPYSDDFVEYEQIIKDTGETREGVFAIDITDYSGIPEDYKDGSVYMVVIEKETYLDNVVKLLECMYN